MAFKQNGSIIISPDGAAVKLQDVMGQNITEKVNRQTISGSTTINFNTANFHQYTVNGNCSFSFSLPSEASRTNTACGATVGLTMSGTRTIVWPSSVRWSDSTPPDISSGSTDWYAFVTYDNGASYWGFNLGREFN